MERGWLRSKKAGAAVAHTTHADMEQAFAKLIKWIFATGLLSRKDRTHHRRMKAWKLKNISKAWGFSPSNSEALKYNEHNNYTTAATTTTSCCYCCYCDYYYYYYYHYYYYVFFCCGYYYYYSSSSYSYS